MVQIRFFDLTFTQIAAIVCFGLAMLPGMSWAMAESVTFGQVKRVLEDQGVSDETIIGFVKEQSPRSHYNHATKVWDREPDIVHKDNELVALNFRRFEWLIVELLKLRNGDTIIAKLFEFSWEYSTIKRIVDDLQNDQQSRLFNLIKGTKWCPPALLPEDQRFRTQTSEVRFYTNPYDPNQQTKVQYTFKEYDWEHLQTYFKGQEELLKRSQDGRALYNYIFSMQCTKTTILHDVQTLCKKINALPADVRESVRDSFCKFIELELKDYDALIDACQQQDSFIMYVKKQQAWLLWRNRCIKGVVTIGLVFGLYQLYQFVIHKHEQRVAAAIRNGTVCVTDLQDAESVNLYKQIVVEHNTDQQDIRIMRLAARLSKQKLFAQKVYELCH